MSDLKNNMKIAKVDAERRLVTAIYSVVTKADGTPIVDHQGHVIPIEELEVADIEAFATGGTGKSGRMHEDIGGAHVAQHLTLSAEQWGAIGKALGVDLPPMPECGIAKIFVEDDGLWSEVKAGKLPELSIAGTAKVEDE